MVTVVLGILFFVGLYYILVVLYFAKKVQKQEYYEGEKYLETWDFWQVEGFNLNFLEEASKCLKEHGFRWIDDYRVEEKEGENLKLERHYNGRVECYTRYFVNDVESTIGTISFYKVFRKNIYEDKVDKVSSMHCFSLETALKNNKHLQSNLVYAPSEGAEVLKDLIRSPKSKENFYRQEGEMEDMIRNHINELQEIRGIGGIDSTVTIKPLEEVVNEWWHRNYALRKDRYQYEAEKKCYKLKLRYCIKVVLCYPFFELYRCIE